MICSAFQFQLRPTTSCKISNLSYQKYCLTMRMTDGHTFGAITSFPLQKHTNHSQDVLKLNQFKDKQSTRNMIRRRGMHLDDYQCVLCQQSTEETVMHLLFCCPFAKNCWNLVNFHFGDRLSIQQIFQAWKSMLQIEFSLDIFIIFCWGIWMMRNDVIFRNKNPSVEDCRRVVTVESLLSSLVAQNKVKNHPPS